MAFACLEITYVPNRLPACVGASSLLLSFMSCFCEREFTTDEPHGR